MKKTLTKTFLLILVLTLSSHAKAQNTAAASTPVEHLTLTFELGELPGRNSAGSLWEVSFRWRIADQMDFIRWSAEGEDPVKQDAVGMLLSKQTFTRRNLAEPDNRRFSISVPVKGELLERLRNEGRRQVAWLDAVVRVRDDKLGREVIKRVNPAWGPSFYQNGNANLRMQLTDDWKLQWYTGATPPWAQGDNKVGLNSARIPSPQ
jgi:hypothetical protein